jgi:drug/metabolite transporter (DMT)-like permease
MGTNARGDLSVMLLALAAATLWGLWWAPVRWLEGMGLDSIRSGLVMMTGAGLALVPFALSERGQGAPLRALAGAALCGVAMMLYAASLGHTSVVRAVLLFYLTPAWSVAIECFLLGRRWTWRSGAALALCLGGVAAIFRGDLGAGGFGTGEAMALGAGLGWSVGSALIFTGGGRRAPVLAVAAGAGAMVAGGVLVALAAPSLSPDRDGLLLAVLLALGFGVLYVAPVVLWTLIGALALPPATLGFLLTAEIVSGVVSSALFLDERFGWPEAVGALMVMAGALVETMQHRERHTRPGREGA